jgi:hypothetical protein
MMNKKETIIHVLEKMDLKSEIDRDGDIMIHYQMKDVFIMAGDDSDRYVQAMLPQFYAIKEGEEALILATCNRTTREVKMAKTYVERSFRYVTATCEFFYSDEESLRQNLIHSLKLLGMIRSKFRNVMDELSED